MWKRALLVLVGCGGPGPVAPSAPSLVVRNAGAEPRRVVRIELPAGADEHAESLVDLSITSSTTNTVLETGTKAVTFPTITLREHWKVLETLPDSSARIVVENDRVTTESDVPDPKTQAMFDRILERLRHRRDTFRLLPDGSRADVHIDDGRAQSPDLQGAESDVDVIFPSTPIGVGAEWVVTRPLASNGVQWHDTRTYRLRALDDATASVELQVVADAPPQALSVTPTSSTKLTVGKLGETGQFIIPLHGLVRTGGAHFDAEMRMQLVRKDLRIETAMHLQRAEQIAPVPTD